MTNRAARPDPDDALIGRRLREIAAVRGMSVRVLAGLAGLSKTYVGDILSGKEPVVNRRTLEALANAVQVAPSELSSLPVPPGPAVDPAAEAGVEALRGVLRDIELDMLDVSGELGTLEQAGEEIERARLLSADCEYGRTGAVVPDLVARTYALAAAGSVRAWELHVRALQPAFNLARAAEAPDVAWAVARHMRVAAARIGHPAWTGVADFVCAQGMTGRNGRTRALALVTRSADALTPDDGPVGQAAGLLRLSAALQSAALGSSDDAAGLLDEAAGIARRTGDQVLVGQHFGPRNVGIWRATVAVELGETGRVPEIARSVDVDAIPSRGRRAALWLEVGRGLAATRGQESAAVEALHRAEKTGPQLMRGNVFYRETMGDLFRRARRDAVGRELRGMMHRAGMSA